MPANHQASMTFPAGKDEVFQACLQAVSQCGFRVSGSDPQTGQIEAKTSMGLRSWGENISINVSAGGRADIKSACRGIQLIDYGKNKANVKALFAAISGNLAPQAQQ